MLLSNIPVLHSGGLPHADTLGVPLWLQWLVIALAVGIAGWLVYDARTQRRSLTAPAPEPVEPINQQAGPSSAPPRERLVRATTLTPPKKTARAQPVTTSSTVSPPRLLVLLAGFAAGWVALDRVRGVDALGNFIKTDGAAQVARLGFSFAALLWVGAALAPVSPRGSALAFGVAGAIGTFLATASSWERRLEWWGASAVLNDWTGLPYWAGTAFVLAVLALVAGRYQPGVRRPWPTRAGSVRAANRAIAPDQNV